MGYLRNHLATVVVACFAIFLTGMYFYMPAALSQLLLVSTIVTWFLVFICWIAQKSADYVTRYSSHDHTHVHAEKKSSTKLVTNVSVEELNKFRESFTAELNELKGEVKLKDNEISRMRQEIANLETLVQIEALKAELANLKAVAAKRK
ncbi:MAG: hypothetical protein ACT4OD_00650 [Candidatus Nitrosotenuis sp.]